jgi:hypothetical protein
MTDYPFLRAAADHHRARAAANPTHLPTTGTWNCTACLMAWPCATARRDLIEEYAADQPALDVYLRLCLRQALEDLPDLTVADLYIRFVDWARGNEATGLQQSG